ncbi:MAG: mercuric transport protein [Rhodocyclaceae bacterium]|nr:mercuric transport protein [Rhodocyclaceae bacterium]
MDTQTSSPPPQKRLSLGLMTVAVLSSIVASTCCVVPLILVLVGITGAWMVNLQALKPYVVLFTVIALAALGWAGYLVFRPQRSSGACSAEETKCATVACRSTRKAFILSAVFIAALLLFPFAAPLFY